MASSDPAKEWEVVLETLNVALKQENGGPWSEDSPICGQTVSVVIPESESTQTTRTLRQLLLREIDKEDAGKGARGGRAQGGCLFAWPTTNASARAAEAAKSKFVASSPSDPACAAVALASSAAFNTATADRADAALKAVKREKR
eukprot:g14629.t1